MRRTRPTLASQLFLFMAAVLAGAFILTFAAFTAATARQPQYMSLEEAASRLTRARSLLRGADADQDWDELARSQNSSLGAFSVRQAPPIRPHEARERDLRAYFSAALGVGEDDIVARRDPISRAPESFVTLPGAPLPPGAEIMVRLEQERWLSLRERRASPLAQDLMLAALLYLTGALGLAIACYVFARRLSTPLAKLAASAGELSGPPVSAPDNAPQEVHTLVYTLSRARERIRKHLDERAWLVAAIAHDLRSPLQRLQLRLEVSPPPERAGFDNDLAQIEELLDQALAYSKDEARGRVQRGFVDLARLCGHICAERRDLGLWVVYDPQPSAIVIGDAIGIRRVLANLVDNALTNAGGANVSLRADAEHWLVEVQNIQTDATRARFTASGAKLGLNIARALASAHGGDVLLSGEGATMTATLRIPRHDMVVKSAPGDHPL